MAVSKIAQTSYLQSGERDGVETSRGTYTITYEDLLALLKQHSPDPMIGIFTVDHINDLIVKVDKIYKWYLGACEAANKFETEVIAPMRGRVEGANDENYGINELQTDFGKLLAGIHEMATLSSGGAFAIGTVETALDYLRSRFSTIDNINTDDASYGNVKDVYDTLNETLGVFKNSDAQVEPRKVEMPKTESKEEKVKGSIKSRLSKYIKQ